MFEVIRIARNDYCCFYCRDVIKKGDRYLSITYKKSIYDSHGSKLITQRIHVYNCLIPQDCYDGKHVLVEYRHSKLFDSESNMCRDGILQCMHCDLFEDEFYKLREEKINLLLDI